MKSKHLLLMLLLALIAPWAVAQQVLLTENFDDLTSISSTYSHELMFAYNAGQGNNWSLNTTATYANSGSKSAQYVYNDTYDADCYLVSAPFNVSANMTQLNVSLYECVRSTGYAETFEVFFVKSSTITAAADVVTAAQFGAIASASYTNTSYAEVTGSSTDPALAGQSVRVVVHCTSLADKWTLYIDDITVSQATTDPYVTLTPNAETVFIGYTTTLTATYGNVTGTPTVTFTSNNESVATVTGNGTTATVRGVAAGTATITATMNYQGTDYTATATITVEEPAYCTPSFTHTSTNYGLYIKTVTTTGGDDNISNTTSLTSGGYADYYNTHFASIEAGQPLQFTVTPGSYTNGMKFAMWIDWNNDYDFDDDGEQVAIQSTNIYTDWTPTITIPAETEEGTYRMRILGMYSGTLSPCTSATYGEAEDYKLMVFKAADCQKPNTLVVNFEGTTATATWNGTANSYNIDINGVVTNNVTSPYAFDIDLSTYYTVAVQANCNGGLTSEWSIPYSFYTGCNADDMCELSYELTTKSDYASYGWYGSYIKVMDANTDEILTTWTVPQNVGGTNSGTFAVCDGRALRFEWFSYNAGNDGLLIDTWAIYDRNGEEIASGTGAMTDAVLYTVNCEKVTCFKPTQITVEPSYTTATIAWEGTNDGYNVRYRTAPVTFYDGFEYGLDQWTIYHFGDENTNTYWQTQAATSSFVPHSGNNTAISRSYYSGGYNVDNWLITPQVTLEGTLKFWVIGTSSWPENYAVYVSTTGNAVEDFGTTPFYTPPTITDAWAEIEVDLSSFNGAQGYIAIRDNSYNQDYMLIDDFTIYGNESAAGAWEYRSTTNTSIELEDLEMYTFYEYQLQGVCDNTTTDWTNAAVFQTLNGNEKQFLHEGLWNVDANWMPEGVPTANQNVHIFAPATIPAGCVAEANAVTMETGGSLFIKDGGQLQFSTGDVTATVEKEILGYGETQENWQLISTPGGSKNPTNVENMLEGDYDLFMFDGTQELEWRNYKLEEFTSMSNGLGYLYANKENTTLRFTTTLYTPGYYYAGGSNNYLIHNTGDEYEFGTFNLLGNCFMRNGYLMYLSNSGVRTDITDFYVMSEDGSEIVPNTNPYLAPMQGAFVESTADNQRVLIGVQPWAREEETVAPSLTMTVSQYRGSYDLARIRFAEGEGLEKIQLNPNHTKIYIPQDGKDYAVVYSENQGEMPVNFKAEKNGTYTLSFTTEEVDFGYLHLIDNKTGNDIDLLETPSYTFDAQITDYAQRFKLVFNTNATATDDSFAYINGMGNIVINGAEAGATMQVMDMTGRIILNANAASSISTNGMPAGVYVIRLINGSDVKTQKIVVK